MLLHLFHVSSGLVQISTERLLRFSNVVIQQTNVLIELFFCVSDIVIYLLHGFVIGLLNFLHFACNGGEAFVHARLHLAQALVETVVRLGQLRGQLIDPLIGLFYSLRGDVLLLPVAVAGAAEAPVAVVVGPVAVEAASAASAGAVSARTAAVTATS